MSGTYNPEASLLPTIRVENDDGNITKLCPTTVASLFNIASRNNFGLTANGLGLAITQAVHNATFIEDALERGEELLIGQDRKFRRLALV